MALVDILVDVLDGTDGGYALHIDVAAVLPQQVGAVADHPAIVHLFAIDSVGLGCVPAAHVGIGIFSDSGGVPEWLGEALGAVTILLAWGSGQGIIARGMNHVLLDQCKQLRLSILIGQLSRQQAINKALLVRNHHRRYPGTPNNSSYLQKTTPTPVNRPSTHPHNPNTTHPQKPKP